MSGQPGYLHLSLTGPGHSSQAGAPSLLVLPLQMLPSAGAPSLLVLPSLAVWSPGSWGPKAFS